MAEEVGFEPTVSCPTTDFKSVALNRTQPFLRKFCGNKIVPPKLKNSAYDAKHFKFTYYLINRVVISITALITAGLLFRVETKMEPSVRFELTTYSLQNCCTTTVL